ncbi:MAG: putative rane protein [Chthonomonadaceae bacterium]|nr:putative rane protein [Chthonomonadaceae bacterium]
MHLGVTWNIFLAVLPVFFAGVLTAVFALFRKYGKPCPWFVWLPLGLVWLAFLPNACYLVTEWRHFLFQGLPYAVQNYGGRSALIVIAKDSLFFLAYSLTGCLCFALAIRPIEHLMRKAGGKPVLWAAPFFFLVSLGVYLGLFIRLNTWNIVTHPSVVLSITLRTLSDIQLVKAIVVFGFLLFLLYEILDIFLDGLALRLHRLHRKLPFLKADRKAA